MGWWPQIWKEESKDWIFERLKPDQLPDDLPAPQKEIRDIRAGEDYLTVTLRTMRIVNVRVGWTRMDGVVHSWISLPHRSGKNAVFQVVTAPNNLRGVDVRNLDRVIKLDHPLMGPTPYYGGNLSVELGLFSVKIADLLAPYLAVMEKMSRAAGVAYFNAAQPFVEPITEAIRLLTGAPDTAKLEIGLSRTIDTPQTGWWLLMCATRKDLDVDKLKIVGHELVNSSGRSTPAFPYLVLSIGASKQREDWFMIPELSQAYNSINECLRQGRRGDAENALNQFKWVALVCPDLIRKDAEKIVELVTNEAISAMPTTRTSAAPREEMVPLNEIKLYG